MFVSSWLRMGDAKMRSVLGQKYYVPFHAFCLFTNFIGCAYELAYIKLPIFESYGGRFKFLTHWNQYFHLCYFAYAVVVEIYMLLFNDEESSGSQNQFLKLKGASINSHILRQLGDFIFVSICFPFGVMVCVLFWIITLMEPDGLASKETRKVVPLSSVYNQYLHTFPFILNCLGIWLIQFMYPKRSYGLTAVSILAITYMTWLVHVGNHTGFWCYPFIQHQTMPEFIGFVTISTLASFTVYLAGEKLSSLIWKEDLKKSQ